MNKNEKKKYILKTWSTSSGKRIAEMLRRYWKREDGELIKTAKRIFEV